MVAQPLFLTSTSFRDLYPFQSHFLKIDGLQYHYLDEGQGEPLVMVHGNPTWSFYFRNLVLALREQYRVIVPDHMGCGLSDKPLAQQYGYRLADRVRDLTVLLDHLNLQQPLTLILHDWGGMIGLAWSLDHLDQLGRLVITNTAGFFPPNKRRIPLRLRLIRNSKGIFDWAVLRLNLFARAALYMAPHQPLPKAIRAGLIAPYDRPGHRLATLKFVQDIPLSPNDPSGPLVARVDRNLVQICSCPTLLVWGGHDFVFTRAYYEEWRRRVPDAEAHWLSDAGHYLIEDQPQKVIALIQQFLRTHPY